MPSLFRDGCHSSCSWHPTSVVVSNIGVIQEYIGTMEKIGNYYLGFGIYHYCLIF